MSWVTEIHKQQNTLADTAFDICDLCQSLERLGQYNLSEELLGYAKTITKVAENLSVIMNDKLDADLRDTNEAHHNLLHAILTSVD